MAELEAVKRRAEEMWAADNASRALGMAMEVTAVGAATVRMRVREDMVNGFGVCHGGLQFTLADTAFAFACNIDERVTVAASCDIEFLRPVHLGDELVATASEDYRGRRNGFYTVRVMNQDDALVALFRGRSVSRNTAAPPE